MSAEGGPAGYRIRFADDGPEFRCLPGDTLLRAALREGIGLPYECVSGGCGTCRVQLKSGDLDDVWPQAPGLPARSRDRGFRLACQSRPQSDCMISIRMPLVAPHGPRPRSRRATLVSRETLTQDMAEFQFTTGDAADFLPGQFALLSLPGVTGDRAYSMSNLPNADGHWRFTIKRMNNGAGGRALFEAMTVGTEITLDGPYGLSYLRTDSPRDIVCIAGGSGLSPVMSILAAAARDTLADRRITLFFGARQPADLCAETLIARDPVMAARVARHHAISDPNVPAVEWSGERGFIHEVARRHLEAVGNPADNDYYFCGPSPMTEAVQKMLFDLKVPVGQIFYDRFV
jgi:toluene monooxygenase electron transfer component